MPVHFTYDISVNPMTMRDKCSYPHLIDEEAVIPRDCGIRSGFSARKRHHQYKATFESYAKVSFLLLETFLFKSVKRTKMTILMCVKYCFGVLASARRYKKSVELVFENKIKMSFLDCILLKTKTKSLNKKTIGINKAERWMQNKYIQITKSPLSQLIVMT